MVAKIKLNLRNQFFLYRNTFTFAIDFQIIMRFKVIFCPKIVTWISNSELVFLRLTETSRNLFEMQNKCNINVTDTNLWPVGRQTLIEPFSLKKLNWSSPISEKLFILTSKRIDWNFIFRKENITMFG